MAFSFQTLIPHLVVANGVLKGDTTAAFRAALTGTLIGGRSPLSLVVTQRLAERDKPPETAATADKPPAVETVPVPDVVGKNEAQAKESLRASGVVNDNVETIAERPKPVGEVIKQAPVAGTPVPKGSKVGATLTVIGRTDSSASGRGQP